MLLRTKIILNLTLMSLLMIGIGAGGFWASLSIRDRLTDITRESIPALEALASAQGELWVAARDGGEDAASDLAFRNLEAAILEYSLHAAHPEKADFKRRLRARVLELREELETLGGAELTRRVNELGLLLRQAMDGESEQLAGTREAVSFQFRAVGLLNSALIAVGVLFLLLPGWRLAVRISRSLLEAREAANEVASGDLTRHLPERGDDEITVLAQSFNRMVETIRQADEEISREVEDRIQAERSAQSAARAKSDFLAHMSHEFRTPLNGILGYSQILLLDKGLPEKNREVVGSLRRSGENLLELINDVLDLTKIEARKMNLQNTRFYLHDFLESLAETYAEQIRFKGLEFRLRLGEGLPEDILSDPIRLRQVLVNLVGNAIKFTDEGFISLEAKALTGGVRFKVKDSGIGIPEENVESIMQPFTQVENPSRSDHGTGLGLSLSSRLLEMMGAELRVKSVLGRGSTFWFDLPQPDVRHRKMVLSPNRIVGYEGRRRTLLIAEQGTQTATLLGPLLRKVGFGVHHSRSPGAFAEDMELLKPDAVLLDLYFGEEGGVERMKEQLLRFEGLEREAPVFLMFSDHRKATDRERALAAGAVEFLGMPPRFADLLKMLEAHLEITWREAARDAEEPPAGEPAEAAGLTDGAECPDPESLRELLGLAQAGNIKQIRLRLEALRKEDPRVEPFCERMVALCSSYRINAINELLLRLLERDTGSPPYA